MEWFQARDMEGFPMNIVAEVLQAARQDPAPASSLERMMNVIYHLHEQGHHPLGILYPPMGLVYHKADKVRVGPSELLEGQKGLFAKMDLQEGEWLTTYQGWGFRPKSITEHQGCASETHVLTSSSISIDGFPLTLLTKEEWDSGHFGLACIANSFSGIADPNCKIMRVSMRNYLFKCFEIQMPHELSRVAPSVFVLTTTRNVAAGDELFADYAPVLDENPIFIDRQNQLRAFMNP